MSSGSSPDAELYFESTTPTSASSSSFSSATISAYNWCAALGGIGFLETVYLTYLKLTTSDAFCPICGDSCGDVLNTGYAIVFGVPLPAIGIVPALSLQLPRKNLPFGIGEASGRFILLASTTSMAASSGFFLYILGTKFSEASCPYCLLSPFLSFSLFFITEFGLQEIQKVLGLQLCMASLAIAALRPHMVLLHNCACMATSLFCNHLLIFFLILAVYFHS